MLQKYADKRHLSWQQVLEEPAFVIQHAFVIWELEAENAKVKAASQQAQ